MFSNYIVALIVISLGVVVVVVLLGVALFFTDNDTTLGLYFIVYTQEARMIAIHLLRW